MKLCLANFCQAFDFNRDGVLSYKEVYRALRSQKLYHRCVHAIATCSYL